MPEPHKGTDPNHLAVAWLLQSAQQVGVREGVRQVSAEEPRPSSDLFEWQNGFCPSGSISIKILNIA